MPNLFPAFIMRLLKMGEAPNIAYETVFLFAGATGADASNKPLEWSGHHKCTAAPPHTPCLPLRGSVRLTLHKLREVTLESN